MRRRRPGRVRHSGRMCGDDIGDQASVAGHILAGNDCGLGNGRKAEQDRLDFSRLDSIPSNLDLLVGPATEEKRAVRLLDRKVAGSIHALAGPTEWVGEKARGRQSRNAPCSRAQGQDQPDRDRP